MMIENSGQSRAEAPTMRKSRKTIGSRAGKKKGNSQKSARRSKSSEERLLHLVEHPPEGSAIAEAKRFGVDLYGILENLKLTPAERFRRAAEETDFVQRLRQNTQKAHS